jgi:hypothetical protein
VTTKEARRLDSFVLFCASAGGAIGFGDWKHSLAAGVFAWVALAFIGNIGWAIEYRGIDYESEHKP